MNKLNHRFLSELFEQKKVRCHQEIYNNMFNYIWPCQWYFREFLSCSATDLKIDCAKRIFSYLRAVEDVILPEFVVNNIISIQQKKLVTSNDGYIPQDHIIHSINLYILGIYLFFNFPLFHKKILSKDVTDKTLFERTKNFVKKWRAFSFLHDVGYYFEINIDGSGVASTETLPSLCDYKNLYTYLIFEYVTRSVARTILCAAFIQRSHQKISLTSFHISPNMQWNGKNSELVESKEIIDMLKDYENATILEDIQSDNAYSHLVMLLEKQKALVIVYNQEEYPVAFIERFGNKVNKIYLANDCALNRATIYNESNCEIIWSKLPSGYTLKYCVKDADEAVYTHLPVEYAFLAKHYYNQIPETFRLKLSLATTDAQINQCFFDIYQWLAKKAGKYLCLEQSLPEFDIYKQSMKEYYEAAINSCLSSHISKIVHDSDYLESVTIEKLILSIAKGLREKSCISDLSMQIHTNAARSYGIEEGISHDVLSYYQQTYYQVIRHFLHIDTSISQDARETLKERLEKLQFVQLNSERIVEIYVFKHGESTFETNLYNRIKECAEKLKIDFNKLTSYSTPYTRSDHGLISASLLYQATVFSHCLSVYATAHNDLKLAWHGLSGFQSLSTETCTNDYAEVIFSILLHNIYARDSTPMYGIDYKHSIDDDPFSYFCAFCDTFQKWDRPKQIDHSKTGLPPRHFLSEEFDLFVTEDKICLMANSTDTSFIRQSLHEENIFLPGILDIIHVLEYHK